MIADFFEHLNSALDEYFLCPAAAQARLEELVTPLKLWSGKVIGAPDAPIALLRSESAVRLVGEASVISRSPFAKELCAVDSYERASTRDRKFAVFDIPLDQKTTQRLDVPRVLLVNLFHRDMYPTPRLTLGTGYIAAHLREQHVADVALRDFQFPISVRTLLEEISITRYQIVGLSANFGQLDILEEVLSGIANGLSRADRPIVALGNILPAMSASVLLERFPDTIICLRDGELMMEMLAREYRDRASWHNVPGAVFREAQEGKIVRTAPKLLDLDALPPPAFDSAVETLRHGGVITAEFSRGCQYNICSFCPRSHKASSWRGMTGPGFLRHLTAYKSLFGRVKSTPYIFLADEEFIGAETEGFAEGGRISQFLDALGRLSARMRFDAASRADQAFSEIHDQKWHLQRGVMFNKLKEAGLSRLFIGVESGSDPQLLRYNKGTDVHTNISALRYLSMLGIKLRFGFITFDPLITAEELCQNIEFMARKDVVLPPRQMDVTELFKIVRDHHRKELQGNLGRPVFEEVSYVASPLEVLLKSRYLAETRASAPELVSAVSDVGFARVDVQYRDPLIHLTSELCQRWINHCFPVVYTLKGLQKTSDSAIAATLSRAITLYRASTFFLLRSLASEFGLASSERSQRWAREEPSPIPELSTSTKTNEVASAPWELGNRILERYNKYFRSELKDIDLALQATGLRSDAWTQTYLGWREQWHVAPNAVRQR